VQGPIWLTGGTAGPEAGLFDFVALAFYFALFHFLFPAKQEPAPAAELPAPAEADAQS